MFKFNDNHILVGYIKELLSEFNLPNLRVYTKENQEYFDKTGTEKNIIETDLTADVPRFVTYIKDDLLQQYVVYKEPETEQRKKEWRVKNTAKDGKTDLALGKYYFNKPILNLTKHLRLTNNIYDSYTHMYLGNYLRFLRDYKNFNLMPLYNCFSNTLCSILEIATTNEGSTSFKFNTKDTDFKIYMLPVKLFKNYTVAIDSNAPVEMCCGIYDKYQDTRKKFDDIYKLTYKKYDRLSFNSPVLYSKLTEITNNELLVDVAHNENDLKLFIKLPATNASSITILEGDYRNSNDSIYLVEKDIVIYKNNTTSNELEVDHVETSIKRSNRFITNYENFDAGEYVNFKPITQLQLLKLNTGESYPFADRLIEYILEQAIIDNDEEISDNVKRAEAVVLENNNTLPLSSCTKKEVDGEIKFTYSLSGLWSDKLQRIFYDYMNTNSLANTNTYNHDILGYVDKDVEKLYRSTHIEKIKKSRQTINTLKDVDIYEEQSSLITGGKS